MLDEHRVLRKAEKEFLPKDMVDISLDLVEGDDDIDVKLTDDNVKGFILVICNRFYCFIT